MTNRFTKTSFFVQGGIMRPPSDGGLKTYLDNVGGIMCNMYECIVYTINNLENSFEFTVST